MKDTRKKKRKYKEKTESTEEENDKEMEKKKKEETIDGGGWKRALHIQIENQPLSGATGKITSESLYSLPAALLRNPLL